MRDRDDKPTDRIDEIDIEQKLCVEFDLRDRQGAAIFLKTVGRLLSRAGGRVRVTVEVLD
jgi:hypothetical protein